MDNLVFLGIQLLIAVICFVLGKYVFPAIPKDKLAIITAWAEKFVIWARDFFEEAEGELKMQMVLQQLRLIAEQYGIAMTDEQLEAIAQTAYDAMKRGMNNDPA